MGIGVVVVLGVYLFDGWDGCGCGVFFDEDLYVFGCMGGDFGCCGEGCGVEYEFDGFVMVGVQWCE